jgi:hypothetical protein
MSKITPAASLWSGDGPEMVSHVTASYSLPLPAE